MNPGERIVFIGWFLWMCVSVGPWWIGLILFGAGWIANMLLKDNSRAEGRKEG
jgi:hypothetical protein